MVQSSLGQCCVERKHLQCLLLQIILPASHACKTLDNKYEKVWAARRAAAAAVAAGRDDVSGGSSATGLASDSSTKGSCTSSCRSDALGHDSVVGTPLRQLRKLASSGGRAAAAAGGAGVLHAYNDQVLLLQLKQLTLAAPAGPVLLQQMQEDCSRMEQELRNPSLPLERVGTASLGGSNPETISCRVPQWMQDVETVQRVIDNSNRVVAACCIPAAPKPQQAPQHGQQQPACQAGVAVPGALPSASVAVPQHGYEQLQQQPQQQQASAAGASMQQQQRPRTSPAAASLAMRHGILLLPEDASLQLAAGPPARSVRAIFSTAAVKQWFRRQVAKVAPRRLVIRPGDGMNQTAQAAAAEASQYAAAGAGAGTSRLRAAGAGVAAQQAAAVGLAAGSAGSVVLAAHCLLDFQGLELLAGRMERVQVPLLAGADSGSVWGTPGPSAAGYSWSGRRASTAGGVSPAPARASGDSLVGLTHMITRTDVQCAVHEFIRPAAGAAATAAVPSTPGTSGSTMTAAAAVQPGPTGCNVVALAAADGLALQLSGCGYQYLMAMVFGNLMHYQSSFEPYVASAPNRPQHTAFNPNIKFGPSVGQMPYFALTLTSCAIQVSNGLLGESEVTAVLTGHCMGRSLQSLLCASATCLHCQSFCAPSLTQHPRVRICILRRVYLPCDVPSPRARHVLLCLFAVICLLCPTGHTAGGQAVVDYCYSVPAAPSTAATAGAAAQPHQQCKRGHPCSSSSCCSKCV